MSNKHQAIVWPPEVTFEGKIYYSTSKHGTNVATGLPSAEYRCWDKSGDDRVWLRSDGYLARD